MECYVYFNTCIYKYTLITIIASFFSFPEEKIKYIFGYIAIWLFNLKITKYLNTINFICVALLIE